jgi:hypothetical protein
VTLRGKGFYIWQISRCENGDPATIASEAAKAGLTHVLIKIADGASAYNISSTTGEDLVPPVAQALWQRGIHVWGWHYVYGYDPVAEANIAIQRIQGLGLEGYIIDAEAQYKYPGRDAVAREFMTLLRQALPTFPIALSSYRFPTYHPTLPWEAFLEKCDYNMPQVYWELAHNPGEQLIRSVNEFMAITPFRPIIPTGSAYMRGDWQPTSAEIIEFLDTARNLNLSAANFWEWGHTRLYLPHLWYTISDYNWPLETDDRDLLVRYFEALNMHNIDLLVGLYHDRAVHVTPERTVQGKEAIRTWYTSLFNEILPNANFALGENSGDLSSRIFSWTATSTIGDVSNGRDSIGIVDNQIIYHYTQFSN